MYNIDFDIIHKYLVGGLWPTNKKKDGWYGFRCNARCEKTALDIWYMLEIDYHSFPNPVTNLFPSMFWCFPRRPLQSRRWIKQLKSLKSGESELFVFVFIQNSYSSKSLVFHPFIRWVVFQNHFESSTADFNAIYDEDPNWQTYFSGGFNMVQHG